MCVRRSVFQRKNSDQQVSNCRYFAVAAGFTWWREVELVVEISNEVGGGAENFIYFGLCASLKTQHFLDQVHSV